MKPFPSSPSVSLRLTGALEFVDDFLFLDAPVLKPDCHLSLCQARLGGYPPPFVLGDEFIGGVLPFQFFQLHLGVWHTLLSPTADRVLSSRYGVWKKKKKNTNKNTQSTSHQDRLETKNSIFNSGILCLFLVNFVDEEILWAVEIRVFACIFLFRQMNCANV